MNTPPNVSPLVAKLAKSIERTMLDYRTQFNALPNAIEVASDIIEALKAETPGATHFIILGWQLKENPELQSNTMRAAGSEKHEPPAPVDAMEDAKFVITIDHDYYPQVRYARTREEADAIVREFCANEGDSWGNTYGGRPRVVVGEIVSMDWLAERDGNGRFANDDDIE